MAYGRVTNLMKLYVFFNIRFIYSLAYGLGVFIKK